jgi:2-C-methyl-D-erythritol 4-phosphate cytidylyltransferase
VTDADPGSDIYGAVIVAAGSGVRMEGQDKLFTRVGGRPLLAHAIAAFEECWNIQRIALVMSESNLELGRAMVREQAFTKVVGVCSGGPRRQDSVRCGLETLGPVGWVAVHDGGRPLVRPGMIARGLEAARQSGAAVPVIPVADTVKEISDEGCVKRTLDRSHLRAVQTPQVFRYDLLMQAHRDITGDVTDDSAMVEMIGGTVLTYEGRRRNVKITTPDDLWLAETYLE